VNYRDGRVSVSPTDLANFLACRHKTALDRLVELGRLQRPFDVDPLAQLLRERGVEHERHYVDRLRAQGLRVVDLGGFDVALRRAQTLDAMRDGADVIVQAVLADDRWLGYADILRRVPARSPVFGGWSYEAQDTKLSRETRGGTILQLCVYSDLLGAIQQLLPDAFHVVTPVRVESYRTSEFAAFFRQVRSRFLEFLDAGDAAAATYPEPVDHCEVCRWWKHCRDRRRGDDHLSFVAGLGRLHRAELGGRGVHTLAALAAIPSPIGFKPRRGNVETYERLRDQARLQAEQRTTGALAFELLPVDKDFGLTQLPEPRPGDLFLDLEGDPFGRDAGALEPGAGGREYLFGLGRVGAGGEFTYAARWAFTDAEELAAFDAVMSDIVAALDDDPSIHVYHYAPYEPSAFKRLMGRYATREADLDRLLRGRRFVDLYAIVRHALRAGIERYSIKDLEPFCGFEREVPLEDAGRERRLIEVALERHDTSSITPAARAAVEGYNRDDCRSVLELRRWLESLRAQQVAGGAEIPRPPLEPDAPSEEVSARQQRVNALRERLLAGVPDEAEQRTPDQQAAWLLAYLLDWHYREDKVSWWEYYRLLALADDDLLDEPAAVAGLELVQRLEVVVGKNGRPTGSVVDRYRYPPQECEIRRGDTLKLRDETRFGEVIAVDRLARTIDVRKGPSVADRHPASAFAHDHISPEVPAQSLGRLGELVAEGGLAAAPPPAVELLLRRTARQVLERPVFRPAGSSSLPLLDVAEVDESVVDFAVRVAGDLAGTTLPIQGPPGSGKTYTGARMIAALVAQGKRVGVTATGHKVIRNLLDAVAREAEAREQPVRLGHRVTDYDDDAGAVLEIKGNSEALNALTLRQVDVLGGTAWLWSRKEFAGVVDVLFVDEAGQMSLANTLAVSQAASAVVLLGDPQQLEQPEKGSHPDGVGVSALDHILEGHQTMPSDRGLFLPVTWRLSPAITAFTSEVFYEGKLQSKPGLERQRLARAGRFNGSGLFVVDAAHDGCRNASDEEVEIVAAIVDELSQSGAAWIDERGQERSLSVDDILIVAPYNAQVSRLQERLPACRVGTVDKFQGQEAPVVIYSMTSSSPEDAPRGMEFLYSLNRLNVATSRAKCACILVANPRLFEPECRTPRQMQLANALARFRELAGYSASSGAPPVLAISS
jgi:uncharacterized protein